MIQKMSNPNETLQGGYRDFLTAINPRKRRRTAISRLHCLSWVVNGTKVLLLSLKDQVGSVEHKGWKYGKAPGESEDDAHE